MRPERPVGAEVVLLARGHVLLRYAVPPVLVHGVQVQLDWAEEEEYSGKAANYKWIICAWKLQATIPLHSDTVSSSCWFGDCFLESCFGLGGRIRVAFQPRQVSYYSSNFQKTFTKPIIRLNVSRCM